MVERNQDGDDGSDLTRSDETQRLGEEKEQATPREGEREARVRRGDDSASMGASVVSEESDTIGSDPSGW